MFVQKIVTKLNQKQKLEINKLNNDNNDLIRKLFKWLKTYEVVFRYFAFTLYFLFVSFSVSLVLFIFSKLIIGFLLLLIVKSSFTTKHLSIISLTLSLLSFLVLIFLLLFPSTLYFIHYFFSYVHLSSLFFCCLLSLLIEDLIRKTSLLQHYQRKQSKHETNTNKQQVTEKNKMQKSVIKC